MDNLGKIRVSWGSFLNLCLIIVTLQDLTNARGEHPCEAQKPSPAQVGNLVKSLQQVIKDGIDHTHEAFLPTTFNGSFDWHSNVHAHWALLSMARVYQIADLENWIINRLPGSRLENERAFLSQPGVQSFELPYGQAWLLLMLAELKHRVDRVGDPAFASAVKMLQRETEQRLITWLERNPFPEFPTTFVGQHDSWLFAYYLAKQSQSDSPEFNLRLKSLESKLNAPRVTLRRHGVMGNDFLFLPAILTLIEQSETRASLNELQFPFDLLPKMPTSVALFTSHLPGAYLTSLWPMAFSISRGESTSCDLYYPSLKAFIKKTKIWKENFDLVSHWVPQFLWMALWQELGRP